MPEGTDRRRLVGHHPREGPVRRPHASGRVLSAFLSGQPWQLGNGERARASGWLSRALSHRKMRKKPNRLRLTGAYLAAYSAPDGNIALPAEEIVQACSLSGPVELVELLEWLVRLQCITPPDLTRERVEVSLTEVTGWMAPVPIPAPTPPRITPASTPLDVPAVDRAHDLVDGVRRRSRAGWVPTATSTGTAPVGPVSATRSVALASCTGPRRHRRNLPASAGEGVVGRFRGTLCPTSRPGTGRPRLISVTAAPYHPGAPRRTGHPSAR